MTLRKSKVLSARSGAEKTCPRVVSVAWVDAGSVFGCGRIGLEGIAILRWIARAAGARQNARRVDGMRILRISNSFVCVLEAPGRDDVGLISACGEKFNRAVDIYSQVLNRTISFLSYHSPSKDDR